MRVAQAFCWLGGHQLQDPLGSPKEQRRGALGVLGHVPRLGPILAPKRAKIPCTLFCCLESKVAPPPPSMGGALRPLLCARHVCRCTCVPTCTSTPWFIIVWFCKTLASPGQPRTCPAPAVPQLPVGLAHRRVFMFAPVVSQDKSTGISPSPGCFCFVLL